MDSNVYFGAALRQHREKSGISQEELADKSGLDRTYVSGIERGVRNPTLKVLGKLSCGLGISLEALFATAERISLQTKREGR